MLDINLYAVLLAAASSFVLGGLWYSPALFLTPWQRGAGVMPKSESGHPARVFVMSFIFAVIAALAFAVWLGPKPSLLPALIQGLIASVGFVATSLGINYQFSNRNVATWLIDSGYYLVQFLLFGLILGLWH